MSRRPIVLVVASALMLSSIVVGVLVLRHRSDSTPGAGVARGATEAAAMVAARRAAENFFTIDPVHVEQQIDAVLASSTGAFLREYTARRTEAINLVRARKRTVSASVPPGGIAIADFSESRAVVLVAVNQSATEGTGKPVLDQLRVLLTMVRSGSVWKTATLDQVDPTAEAAAFRPGHLPGGNSAVLAAAANGVQHLLASEYRTVDADLQSTIGLLTISFASEFAQTFAANVRPTIMATKAVTVVYVRAVGLVVRAQDRVRCLVYADQVGGRAGSAVPTPARLFVDLARVKGRWLVDGLARP